MTIQQRPSPNKERGRNGQVPDHIVMHVTGGSFPGSLDWISPRPGESVEAYRNRPHGRVSYHFTNSRDGVITQHVRIEDTAWANGTNNVNNPSDPNDSRSNRHSLLPTVRDRRLNANSYTVSIGNEGHSIQGGNVLSDKQMASLIWLVGHIQDEIYNIYGTTLRLTATTLIGHTHITPRHRPSCPGRDFPYMQIIDAVNGVNDMPTPTNPAPQQNFRINGQNLRLEGINVNGVIYAPIRRLLEEVGADVYWEGATNTVVVNSAPAHNIVSLLSGATDSQWRQIANILGGQL